MLYQGISIYFDTASKIVWFDFLFSVDTSMIGGHKKIRKSLKKKKKQEFGETVVSKEFVILLFSELICKKIIKKKKLTCGRNKTEIGELAVASGISQRCLNVTAKRIKS